MGNEKEEGWLVRQRVTGAKRTRKVRLNPRWMGIDTVCTKPTEQHRPVGLVFLEVVVPLVLLAGLAFWLWKHR